MRLSKMALLASTLLVMAPAGHAFAQDDAALARSGLFLRDRNVAVDERPKPEYQPLPVRVGAFILDPTIAGGLEYNDNIYATNTNTVSDGIFHVDPSITAVSDWNRNQVSAFAKVDGDYYFDRTTENFTDYSFGAAGRLDVQHDLGFAAGATFEHDTEPRTSEASPVEAIHPIAYDYATGFIEGTKEFDRLRLTAKGTIDDYSYNNAETPGHAEIYEKDRDHTDLVGAFKAEYAYLPDFSLLASLVLNKHDYRNTLPGEILRNSDGYEATVGVNFDLTHLARGEFYLGYLDQTYDSSQFKDVSGFAIRGKVEYFPTQLTTVSLSGSRTVQDSGIFDVGGFFANDVALQVDHELLRNVVLTAQASYAEDDYQNYSRTDRISSEGVGVLYLMNRALTVKFNYTHLNQDSTGSNAGPKFDINRVYATIGYQF
jgi:hypothetical protein